MPTITSPSVSPSCSSECIFCKTCDQSIEISAEMKCDDCEKYFHKQCSPSNKNKFQPDLIQLCRSCTNEKRVGTPKSKLEKKKEANEQNITTTGQDIRTLRSRAVSINSRVVAGELKAKQKWSTIGNEIK